MHTLHDIRVDNYALREIENTISSTTC